MEQNVLLILDALAGAGKTYALARYADRLARRGKKVLFLQPTKELINKTIADELQPLEPDYPIRPIHSDTDPDRVIAEIVAHFKAAGSRGEIVCITHAAFLVVSYFEKRSDWVLIVDEIPQVDLYCELNLPNTHGLITPCLRMEPWDAAYGLLAENGGSAVGLGKIARNDKKDDLYRQLARSGVTGPVGTLGCVCSTGSVSQSHQRRRRALQADHLLAS